METSVTVPTCIVLQHHLVFLVLASIVCASGAFVTMSLTARSRSFDGAARVGWLFLTATCLGTSAWTTHFVAMLGYRPDIPATFDPVITAVSILIAIVGTGFGLALTGGRPTTRSTIAGGAFAGFSLAGMHYLGMFGYRVVGFIEWNRGAVALSFLASIVLDIAALWCLRRSTDQKRRLVAAALLTLGILLLHLIGMTAMTVTPSASPLAEAMGENTGIALALSLVALLVIGAGLSTCVIDMDARIRSDKSLVDMAFRDPLTGLSNRRALQAKLEQAFADARRFKLLLIDLDHFKIVNDTFGHAVGDKLLCEMSARLAGELGPDACAYRIGGDEFAAIVFRDRDSAVLAAHEIVGAMTEPMEIDGHRIQAGCSIGLCSSENVGDAETLMHRADTALYEAKRRGRRQVVRYTPGMLEAEAHRAQLEEDLQRAVERGEFQIHYQPIVDPETLRTLGYEALLRWTHPTRGAVSPAEFIPLAEECGAIVGIGKWVLEEACRAAATWSKDVYVTVNVSASQLRSARFPALVARTLADTGLTPKRLVIELTETAIVTNDDEVAALLNAVRALGVRVAMDDFGTGYSSLTHLRRLPVDVIKIDRSFVTSAEADRNSMAVLSALVRMGHDMEIVTIGEGVETQAQRDILRRVGCAGAQGYLFGRPAPFVPAQAETTAA